MSVQSQKNMSELALNAGLGAASLSRVGWLIARHYHLFLGLLIAAILLAVGLATETLLLTLVLCLIYTAYLMVLTWLRRNPTARNIFYRSWMQFLRTQGIVVAVTLLLAVIGPYGLLGGLWLLYVLAIQMVSRHGSTWMVILVTAESSAALFFMNVGYSLNPGDSLALQHALGFAAAQSLGLAMLAFMLHYLIRNIDARDETIQAQRLVGSLASRLSTSSEWHNWHDVLDVCLKALSAQRGSLWKSNSSEQSFDFVAEAPARPSGDGQAAAPGGSTILERGQEEFLNQIRRQAKACCRCIPPADRASGKSTNLGMSFSFGLTHTQLGVPVLACVGGEQRVLAVLCFDFYRPAELDTELLKEYEVLLTNLAQYIKPLIESYEQVEEATVLQRAWRRLTGGTGLDEVLTAVAEVLVGPVGFEFAGISLVDHNEQVIKMVAGVNIDDAWMSMATHKLNSGDIQAYVVKTGERVIIDGWDQRLDPVMYDRFGHEDMLRVFAPIIGPGATPSSMQVIGTIEAGYHKRQGEVRITPRQMRMLDKVIDQASIAIEWAQLLTRVNARAQTLESLNRVEHTILSQRKLEKVLEEIGRSAEQVLKADVVMLYRRDEDEGKLCLPIVFGKIREQAHFNLDLTRQNSLLGQLIKRRKSMFVSDIGKGASHAMPWTFEERGGRPRSFAELEGIRSMAALPLIASNHVVGLLFVNYRHRHQFTQDDKVILELFANMAAWAIRNVGVHTKFQRAMITAERTRLNRELHDSISQHVPAIRLMAESATSVLDTNPVKTRQLLDSIIAAAAAVQSELKYHVRNPDGPGPRIENLQAALAEQARLMRERIGLDIELKLTRVPPLDPHVQSDLYMVAREALSNIVRHANATRATLELGVQDKWVQLRIWDNGRGFDKDLLGVGQSIGLSGMNARVREMHGTMNVESAPGAGTTIVVSVPCQA